MEGEEGWEATCAGMSAARLQLWMRSVTLASVEGAQKYVVCERLHESRRILMWRFFLVPPRQHRH